MLYAVAVGVLGWLGECSSMPEAETGWGENWGCSTMPDWTRLFGDGPRELR